jgi:hypothetical protein
VMNDLRAHLTTYREWQSIASAPRDGTPVDLWIVSASPTCDHSIVDFYCPFASDVADSSLREGRVTDVRWFEKRPNEPGWYASGLNGFPLSPDVIATHWMSRPGKPMEIL